MTTNTMTARSIGSWADYMIPAAIRGDMRIEYLGRNHGIVSLRSELVAEWTVRGLTRSDGSKARVAVIRTETGDEVVCAAAMEAAIAIADSVRRAAGFPAWEHA